MLSVQLAIWESKLENVIESIEWITQDMMSGNSINLTEKEVFKKTGQLYALRHCINLSSDLLDIPDFYWDREKLETLYQQMCSVLNLTRRTRVMNEKLNHCCQLMELLSSHLSDKHHVRLEWMIIILIMVEVSLFLLYIISLNWNFNTGFLRICSLSALKQSSINSKTNDIVY
ncbi:hypothetical protein B4U79_08246 [Dinothrombium tinctorium]|uniref:DUF155 domain-containing protein n=1 Tax=Dinothrombium tinctorium TaxID=1965070 RepID=A0A3S3RV47_9ACAR|nr:hypothetical protein B4U79_08246 [Dinothrombium tinctorium]